MSITARDLRQVNDYLETIYPASVQLADSLHQAGLGGSKSQLRGLETVVNATARFSEVINYVKNQAGKGKGNNNAQKWQIVAPEMLRQLEQLEKQAHLVCADDKTNLSEIKLRLVRGWARQVLCHAFYRQGGE